MRSFPSCFEAPPYSSFSLSLSLFLHAAINKDIVAGIVSHAGESGLFVLMSSLANGTEQLSVVGEQRAARGGRPSVVGQVAQEPSVVLSQHVPLALAPVSVEPLLPLLPLLP